MMASAHTFLAISLFVVVLIFVIWQPRGLSIGWPAAIGGALALILGIVSIHNVIEVVHIVWDATLTFVALILISLILDRIGLFEWAAYLMAHKAKGDGLRLFLWLALLGSVVAMFFANDGAALILTPIVYQQTQVLKLNPKAVLALIMTSGFIADTTSLPLVVSNLVNIVSAGFFHLGFVHYAVHMVPVDVVAVIATILALFVYFRADLPRVVHTEDLIPAKDAIRDPRIFYWSWFVLGFLLIGYFLSQYLQWPVAIFAGAAAVILLVLAQKSPAIDTREIILAAPWKIVVFSIGMYIVVFGLRNAGLTHLLGQLLLSIAHGGTGPAILGTGFIAAGLSSVMNNMPAVMVNALAIHGTGLSPSLQESMAYANVIGSDLGPKITPIGSLATLLWLHVLDQKGIHISWGYYFRVGVLLTIPILTITLGALWLWTLILT